MIPEAVGYIVAPGHIAAGRLIGSATQPQPHFSRFAVPSGLVTWLLVCLSQPTAFHHHRVSPPSPRTRPIPLRLSTLCCAQTHATRDGTQPYRAPTSPLPLAHFAAHFSIHPPTRSLAHSIRPPATRTSFARLPTSPIRPARHPRASFAGHGPRHQHSPLNISLHPRHCF